VEVERIGDAPVHAWPGLEVRESAVWVRLFRKPDEAATASAAGVRRLGELVLARELARLWKELGTMGRQFAAPAANSAPVQRSLQQLGARLQTPEAAFLTPEIFQSSANEHLLREALQLTPVFPLTAARFTELLQSAQRALPSLTWQTGDWTRQLLALRKQALAAPRHYAALEADVKRLLPPDFLAHTPHRQLPHLHRYLRAVLVRNERAGVSPAKDTEKAKQLAPFRDWEKRVPTAQREAFRWLLEEFRVSLFAQELGTAQPVSAKRLQDLAGR
jgi:ATP-dependent helicase HrpA